MTKSAPPPAKRSGAPERSSAIDSFLLEAAALPKRLADEDAPKRKAAVPPSGRLLFALDATASRQPTWDRACEIQGEMFAATASLGGLAVQLAYFRGHQTFEATPWLESSRALIDHMSAVRCQRGMTQIERVLAHAVAESRRHRINALVYVGDAMEELPDALMAQAGELALRNVPVFLFHEGGDPAAAATFKNIARLTRGAYLTFDAASAKLLRDLLAAIAIYAVGGHAALNDFSRTAGRDLRQLTSQLR